MLPGPDNAAGGVCVKLGGGTFGVGFCGSKISVSPWPAPTVGLSGVPPLSVMAESRLAPETLTTSLPAPVEMVVELPVVVRSTSMVSTPAPPLTTSAVFRVAERNCSSLLPSVAAPLPRLIVVTPRRAALLDPCRSSRVTTLSPPPVLIVVFFTSSKGALRNMTLSSPPAVVTLSASIAPDMVTLWVDGVDTA